MNELMREYLEKEEGLTNLTDEEVKENIEEGVKVFGSLDLLKKSLRFHLGN